MRRVCFDGLPSTSLGYADNVRSTDWVVLRETNTIVDVSGERLRVSRALQAREIIKSRWPFGPRFYLFVKGYNPQLYFVVLSALQARPGRAAYSTTRRGDRAIHCTRSERMANPRAPWYGLLNKVPINQL